ncbi:MAG: MFS transporter [Chloroflexi bacterium]|nr:MFS transporter [Chloroflexota bacterium]MBV9598632.1 MFS transporter [Chloroflexota bacterium]
MLRESPALLRHVGFFLAALAVLMASIDGTITVVALPQLTESLDTSLALVGWTLTSYQLVQIVMYPLAGQLSDMFGRRRVFLFCVTTFTLSSLLCGLAPNVFVLIVFRAVQAVGGGGLLPSVIGLIADEYRQHRAQAIGLISSIMPIGSIIGPNLGGFLLENWSWRAMFFINVPIGILLVLGFVFLMPGADSQTSNKRLHVDAIGLLQFIGAIVSLMYGMTLIADNPSQAFSPLVWLLFLFSVVLVVAFARHVRRTPNAIMEYHLLAGRPFLAANIYNFFFGAVTMGFYSFIPFYAVVKYGLTPFESAAVLTPRAIVVMASSAVASLYVKRLGYRVPMLIGMIFVGATFVLMAQGWSSVDLGVLAIQGFWLLAIIISIGGFGMGLANPASSNAAIDQAPDKAASITGIRGVFRLAGGTISISCVVLALSFFQDQAAGLDVIFVVFTAVLLVTVPLVVLIPEAAATESRLRVVRSLPDSWSRSTATEHTGRRRAASAD